MSKPAFTPGPWRAVFADQGGYDAMTDALVIENAEGKEIAALDLYHYGQKHCADGYEARKKAEPIAALIAAAPEMLEALKLFLEDSTADQLVSAKSPIRVKTVIAAREAVYKATGE